MRTVDRERVRVVCGRVAPVCASRNVNYRMKPEAGWIRRANRKEALRWQRGIDFTAHSERRKEGARDVNERSVTFLASYLAELASFLFILNRIDELRRFRKFVLEISFVVVSNFVIVKLDSVCKCTVSCNWNSEISVEIYFIHICIKYCDSIFDIFVYYVHLLVFISLNFAQMHDSNSRDYENRQILK